MDTINEIKRQELPEEQEIDLIELAQKLSEERRGGKGWRSRWSPYH